MLRGSFSGLNNTLACTTAAMENITFGGRRARGTTRRRRSLLLSTGLPHKYPADKLSKYDDAVVKSVAKRPNVL